MSRLWLLVGLLLMPFVASADPGIPALTLTTDENGGQSYSLTLQILALMTVLTLLPAGLMMMTSFTRIIIVMAILRQALGVQSTPSNQVLLGLALFLTIFIMHPVFGSAYENGVKPYMDGGMQPTEAITAASAPFRDFMLAQTRETDIALFAEIGGYAPLQSAEDVPFSLLLPAFVTSELKTAFQIGFLIFIPFLIIDLVVASVLMAMGMMMLSPMLISLPFKLMLFVLIDGWALLMGTLASSFYL
ncbi:Flagellar biosynthesis protein FliP [Methylophaga frappieri]|uniref:Flagellar biosynthetic protein FliP n=1 Tax=Methylophaga frappieri (strain ATCC BAA-2434 / DSM 25690 / JAM7) TaxID=754477 RepID=I1YHL4_METFJ|nr:flagellar type III secretion system pore protein FliP [Methylophaga frappieri]AFJ02407.1 Flagellar biosynthesis protein FliP [Methylophaga frappieri]